MANAKKYNAAQAAMYVKVIISEYTAAQGAARNEYTAALKCGQALNEAKAKVGHGNWKRWLQENCPEVSERTARDYMKIAKPENQKKIDERLEAEKGSAADLTIREALRLLKPSAEKAPDESESDDGVDSDADSEPTPAEIEYQRREWLGTLAVEELVSVLKEVFNKSYLDDLAIALDAKGDAEDEAAPDPAIANAVGQVDNGAQSFVRRV